MRGKQITQAAVIAAVYVAITLLFAPISYGVIQTRISEALTVIAALTPVAIPGLFIGCIIANFFSGFGLVDILFGSLATLLAAFFTWKLRKKTWFVPLPPVVFNGLIVGFYLHYFTGAPLWSTILYVSLGEAISCYVLGIPLLMGLRKWNLFK